MYLGPNEILGTTTRALYDADKETRLMIDDLAEKEKYILRIQTHTPGAFAADILCRIQKILLSDKPAHRGVVASVINNDGVILPAPILEPRLDDSSFIVQSRGQVPHEVGYFLSGIDEWDIALSGLNEVVKNESPELMLGERFSPQRA